MMRIAARAFAQGRFGFWILSGDVERGLLL